MPCPALQFFAATNQEPRKVAEVLSYLQGVDVGALLDSAAAGGSGGALALGRTSSRSSDAESS